MGTSRAWGQGRTRRILAASALAGAAVASVVACEPTGSLNSTSIAVTTDLTGTSALERNGVDVRWLNCTADVVGDRLQGASPSASARRIADVDCTGKTGSGKDIKITGKVTQALDGRCVRGDLTARTGGKAVFRTDVLGNCNNTAPSAVGANPSRGGGSGGARPTVTVTVTVTESPLGK
ncbi:hypothetical protein OG609_27860 [Streptomyces sp. NBC_01224]|uniref:hypothetical protein n=1 Tax=Streptomyces sp. NBC_01224 TaxID=2903783 RepID=UPI002E0E989B|nr:hypothetical protein OG609_27860 [Streptomyces sp. NBC_01224]